MIEKALHLLEIYEKRGLLYDDLNQKIRDVQGDFYTDLQCIDEEVGSAMMGLIDSILGEELGSYYLYECSKNGKIIVSGKEYPIRNIDDIRNYLNAMRTDVS